MTEPCAPGPRKRPFVAAPDPGRYFPATTIEDSRQRIGRCIEHGKGPALVIGAAGTGKTTLLEVLAEQFHQRMSVVALMGAQLCTRRALLQMILFQMGLPYRGLDEGELRLSILDYLRPHDEPARRILLLVDEAESLPTRLLEELRVLTNVVADGRLLVSLVLVGNASLEERFAEPQMEVFSQRLSARCYLAALGREETFQYIRSQVAAVDCDPDELFTSDGLEAMFAATDGVPRLINQLGDQLVWMAQQTGYAPLDGQIVQQAWSELQQLPAPWEASTDSLSATASTSECSGGVVEFGDLSTGTFDSGDELDAHTETDETDEIDDGHPASIPISAPHDLPVEVELVETEVAETTDVTEELLEQIGRLGLATEPAAEQSPPPQAYNPFEESFDSEEVIFDRYSSFESLLLSDAPQVTNRTDTTFARQLKQCEDSVDATSDATARQKVDAHPETLLHLGVAATLAPNVSSPPEEDPLDRQPVVLPPKTSDNNGPVLQVEDEGRPHATIVPGRQFRRLFSSLESGDTISRIG